MRHSSNGILTRSYGESPLNDKIKVKSKGKKKQNKTKDNLFTLLFLPSFFFFNEDNFQTKQFLKSGLSKSYPLVSLTTLFLA